MTAHDVHSYSIFNISWKRIYSKCKYKTIYKNNSRINYCCKRFEKIHICVKIYLDGAWLVINTFRLIRDLLGITFIH